MKNTITVGVILFVIGAGIGFGVDRVYMGRKLAADSREMEQQAQEENSEELAGILGRDEGADASANMNVSGDAAMDGSAPTNAPMAPVSSDTASGLVGPSPTQQTQASAGINAVAAEDQAPGNLVRIGSLTLATNGWVVIHDEKDGKPGHILGAHRFNAGTHTGQNVELLKETEEGKAYYAMLHADDGDRKFDYRIDLPIKDETGNPVMMRFAATAKPAL